MGRSGVRPAVAEGLVGLLNADITPWVPEHGSLGASGDLAPLAHCALVLLGEGWVLDEDGARLDAGAGARTRRAARRSRWSAKEGLALINGTDGMLGMLLLAIADAAAPVHHGRRDARRWRSRRCSAPTARSSPSCTRSGRIPGQAASAANIHRLLQDSEVMDSHRDDLAHAVQDAYSMRCAPQVAGAARDTLAFAETVAAAELRSVVDNPVVLPDGRVESTGNFHGAPLGFAADFLGIAAAEVGSIAERRVDRLLDVTRSRDLPRVPHPGPGRQLGPDDRPVHGGRHRRGEPPARRPRVGRLRCRPRGMQEDHVSMGWAAACKLRTVLDNLGSLLAVELLPAVRGLQLRAAAAFRPRRRGPRSRQWPRSPANRARTTSWPRSWSRSNTSWRAPRSRRRSKRP